MSNIFSARQIQQGFGGKYGMRGGQFADTYAAGLYSGTGGRIASRGNAPVSNLLRQGTPGGSGRLTYPTATGVGRKWTGGSASRLSNFGSDKEWDQYMPSSKLRPTKRGLLNWKLDRDEEFRKDAEKEAKKLEEANQPLPPPNQSLPSPAPAGQSPAQATNRGNSWPAPAQGNAWPAPVSQGPSQPSTPLSAGFPGSPPNQGNTVQTQANDMEYGSNDDDAPTMFNLDLDDDLDLFGEETENPFGN